MAIGIGNGNGREPGWVTATRVIMPILVTLTLFGVGYTLEQINKVVDRQEIISNRLATLEASLGRRIIEVDRAFDNHERRIDRIEDRRRNTGREND